MLEQYAVYGERCSGTNYLTQLMNTNFDIPLANETEVGHKHFFGHIDLSTIPANECTLFLGIIRHPIHWLNSFYKEQHHIPNRPKQLPAFLFDEFYSVNDDNTIIEGDVNYMTKGRYKNIFEMRFYKNYYLLNILPTQAKYTFLVTYENLRDNTANVLSEIATKFGLVPRFPMYKNVDYYKDTPAIPYVKKTIIIPNEYIVMCIRHLNLIQERRLGYVFTLSARATKLV